MCNFNKQTQEIKMLIHLFMTNAAKNVGGENYLLALIEAMKTKKPNALIHAGKQVSSNNTIIKWNKVVFKDKLSVLEDILATHRGSENPDFNILADKSDKKRKAIINMAKTLSPIEFIVTPQNPNDGSGFDFKVFKTMKDDEIELNPIFIAMFFCSTEFIKKALKYRADD